MIAATYDCGCMPGKITHEHPHCFESFSPEETRPRYTLLRCQTSAPPPSCPNSDCCKPSRCGPSASCRATIPSCPNFDKIHNCSCSPEPPKLPELPDDCVCGLKEVDGCTINPQGQCDPCSTQKEDKVVSAIAKKGLPYKEIEAIINNNRMVIRMQKEPIEDEFEPPCDCLEEQGTGTNVAAKRSTSKNALESTKRCGDDVVYEMSDFSKPGYTCGGQSSMVNQSCDQKGKGGRTITLYPHTGIPHKLPEDSDEKEKEKEKKDKRTLQDKAKAFRAIDLEENPNIFVFRIRKISNSSDGKQKFDFEFRTPRPWLKRDEPIKHPTQDQPQITQQQATVKGKAKRRSTKGKKKKKKKKK